MCDGRPTVPQWPHLAGTVAGTVVECAGRSPLGGESGTGTLASAVSICERAARHGGSYTSSWQGKPWLGSARASRPRRRPGMGGAQ